MKVYGFYLSHFLFLSLSLSLFLSLSLSLSSRSPFIFPSTSPPFYPSSSLSFSFCTPSTPNPTPTSLRVCPALSSSPWGFEVASVTFIGNNRLAFHFFSFLRRAILSRQSGPGVDRGREIKG